MRLCGLCCRSTREANKLLSLFRSLLFRFRKGKLVGTYHYPRVGGKSTWGSIKIKIMCLSARDGGCGAKSYLNPLVAMGKELKTRGSCLRVSTPRELTSRTLKTTRVTRHIDCDNTKFITYNLFQ